MLEALSTAEVLHNSRMAGHGWASIFFLSAMAKSKVEMGSSLRWNDGLKP